MCLHHNPQNFKKANSVNLQGPHAQLDACQVLRELKHWETDLASTLMHALHIYHSLSVL